jgi:hypothetical protein
LLSTVASLPLDEGEEEIVYTEALSLKIGEMS